MKNEVFDGQIGKNGHFCKKKFLPPLKSSGFTPLEIFSRKCMRCERDTGHIWAIGWEKGDFGRFTPSKQKKN